MSHKGFVKLTILSPKRSTTPHFFLFQKLNIGKLFAREYCNSSHRLSDTKSQKGNIPFLKKIKYRQSFILQQILCSMFFFSYFN